MTDRDGDAFAGVTPQEIGHDPPTLCFRLRSAAADRSADKRSDALQSNCHTRMFLAGIQDVDFIRLWANVVLSSGFPACPERTAMAGRPINTFGNDR